MRRKCEAPLTATMLAAILNQHGLANVRSL